MADLNKTVKDALYVTVGLGVISLQRAQVRRRELHEQVQGVVKQAQAAAKDVQGQLLALVGRADSKSAA